MERDLRGALVEIVVPQEWGALIFGNAPRRLRLYGAPGEVAFHLIMRLRDYFSNAPRRSRST